MRTWASVAALVLSGLSGCLVEEPGAPSPSPTPSAAFACDDGRTFETADVNVTIETSKGSIGAVLHGAASPITVCNFLRYANEGFYDGTIWHRICAHVIQAGGITPFPDNKARPTHGPIQNEANVSQLRNDNATLGMARGGDPDSATSHFYVNLRANNYLDYDGQYAPGYAVFGNVTSGWSVVRDIADSPTVPDPPSVDPVLPGGCAGAPAPSDETMIRDIKVV